MYNPEAFREDRLDVLHDAIHRIGLATLVTTGHAGLQASHIPLLLDPAGGSYGTLYGHVALANPQWSETPPGSAALAIFLGPETYVSPNWYPSKQVTGRVVPTWNYIAVHASGPVTFFRDAERLHEIVTRLTDHHEAAFPAPWQVADAPGSYIAGLLKGIVGLEMPIAKIEGKWKLSQNRDAADRAGVVEGLGASDVAALMRQRET